MDFKIDGSADFELREWTDHEPDNVKRDQNPGHRRV